MIANNEFYLKCKKIVDKEGFFSAYIDNNLKRIVFFTWNEKFIDVDFVIDTDNSNREEGECIQYKYDRSGNDRHDWTARHDYTARR